MRQLCRRCEFSNQYAIQIKDPDIDLSGISGNTYTHATPVVQISGTLDGVQTLGLLDGLDTYQLSTGLTIEAGADLTVSPGITLRSTNDDWDIQVYGRLEMNGAYLELTDHNGDNYSTLYVRDGGKAELNGCVISNSNAWLYVLSGGDLVLDGCTFSGGRMIFATGSSGSVVCSTLKHITVHLPSFVSFVDNDLSAGSMTMCGDSWLSLNIANNWWGTTVPSEIESTIVDCQDGSRPCAIYFPYLLAPPDCQRLTGQAFDALTGAPLGGVTITANDLYTTLTDGQGEYTFMSLDPGEFTLAASKDGYLAAPVTVTVQDHCRTRVDFAMVHDTGFGIADVRGRFCGTGQHAYYIDGVSLQETFTALGELVRSHTGFRPLDHAVG